MLSPYQFTVTCDVCGERGLTTEPAWDDTYQHADPAEYAENLKQKVQALEKEKESQAMKGLADALFSWIP